MMEACEVIYQKKYLQSLLNKNLIKKILLFFLCILRIFFILFDL